MANGKRITFAQYFKLNKTQEELDFVDIAIDNGDNRLFLDPSLIKYNNNSFCVKAKTDIQSFFSYAISLIKQNKIQADTLAKNLLFNARESNETKLGYCQDPNRSMGAAFGPGSGLDLFNALKKSKAVQTGKLQDLEETALLIDGIDKDLISDLITDIIKMQLIIYTQEQCKKYSIEMKFRQIEHILDHNTWTTKTVGLPVISMAGNDIAIILVPRNIVDEKFGINAQNFYYKTIIPYILRAESAKAGSRLASLLRERNIATNGKGKLYKKDATAIFPFSKALLYDKTEEALMGGEDLLGHYKEMAKKKKPLDASEIRRIVLNK